MSYILQGRFRLSDLEAPVDAVAPSALFPLQGTVDRVARNGPDRVIVNHHCDGYTPEHARLVFNAVPEIIFVRRDGWSAGAPMALADDLLALWRSEWAATIDLRWTPHRIAVFTGSVPDGPPPLRPRSRVVTRETAERQAFAAQYEHGPISRPTLGLIILAESRVLARQAAHDDFGLSDEEWFYVVSVDALRRVGAHLQGSRYACVDGFYRRRENIECLEFLRASGAEEIVFRPRSDAERAAEPPPTRPPSGQRAIILRDED